MDVAAAAGVSRQTVSRAMNNLPGISAETRDRVLDTARRLAYRPSRFGRGLVTGGGRQIGLVVDDLRNPYWPELAAAIVRAAATDGWTVMLADVGSSADADRVVASLREQVDVVVGYLRGPADVWGSDTWAQGIASTPLIEFDPDGHSDRPGVRLDRSQAIADLASHLAGVGVRHPVILDASPDGEPTERALQMKQSFTETGLTVEILHAAASTAEHAAAMTAQLVRRSVLPDAVVAFNDVMALGVLSACRHAGVDVPRDVRVVGIDGLSLGILVAPTLTTLAVNFDEVARHTIQLASLIGGGYIPDDSPTVPLQRTVQHRLVLRESA